MSDSYISLSKYSSIGILPLNAKLYSKIKKIKNQNLADALLKLGKEIPK